MGGDEAALLGTDFLGAVSRLAPASTTIVVATNVCGDPPRHRTAGDHVEPRRHGQRDGSAIAPNLLEGSLTVSTSPSAVSGRRRTAWRRIAVAAVILVPLAFAGLFVGALPHGDDALDAIPAAVVNQDQLIYQDAADGTKTPVFAGRQLVTELTKAGSGFDWSVSNADDAAKALRAGDIDAVLTIPKDFSKSILSLSSGAPQRPICPSAPTMRTAISPASSPNQSARAWWARSARRSPNDTFPESPRESVNSASPWSTAAAGAGSLADAAASLSGGLSTLSGGAASARAGLHRLRAEWTVTREGVDGLSGGLAKLHGGAAGLTGVSNGVATYTDSVAQLAQALALGK